MVLTAYGDWAYRPSLCSSVGAGRTTTRRKRGETRLLCSAASHSKGNVRTKDLVPWLLLVPPCVSSTSVHAAASASASEVAAAADRAGAYAEEERVKEAKAEEARAGDARSCGAAYSSTYHCCGGGGE